MELLWDIIEKEEDITSEQVLQILKSDTGTDLISRIGIILPDDRVCQEHVYRIGGDEFLIFVETNLDKVSEKALAAKEKVIEAGYHVSVGTASGGNVASVVKVAELRMYEDKKRYYMSQGDRRKMR